MRPTAPSLLRLRLITKERIRPESLRLPPFQQKVSAKAAQESSTVAERLLEAKSGTSSQSWPSNLRVERQEKKTLFWKVARPQRTQLKKLLREDYNQ